MPAANAARGDAMTRPARWCAFVLLLVALLPAAQAAGTVEVRYTDADHYSDAGRDRIDRDRTMKSLSEYLQTLAARLPEGQTLQLEVLDIDLAGELQPRFGASDIRVLRGGADWPRMKLRYTLQAGGTTLKQGQADLSDMGYLQGLQAREISDTELPYEKRMLSRWFEQTILAH
jgi:hypothetical protein